VAAAVLLVGTALLAVGAGLDHPSSVAGFVVACALTVGVVLGRGRVPFVAAVLIALADVVLLLTAS
jgi:hypothetical protein